MTIGAAPPAVQRATSLVPLAELLTEFGVSLASVLERTGIAPDDIRHDAFVPYAAFLAVLDNACRLMGRDDIGLMLGRRQTLAALGPLGDVLRHAATLGEAISDFAAFQSHNSTGGAVYFMRADQDVILGYTVYDAAAATSFQVHDLALAVGCRLIAELTDGAVAVEEMLLSRSEPEDPAPYHRLGRCPVRFGQQQTGILLRASALAFPLPEANPALRDLALARLEAGPHGGPLSVSAQVRHLMRPLLLVGQSGIEDMSARLGLHSRTLRRRLRDEGTNFGLIKDEVRQAAARELLELGGLSIGDISATLDYSSPSAFVHAFHRWTGRPPGHWRASR